MFPSCNRLLVFRIQKSLQSQQVALFTILAIGKKRKISCDEWLKPADFRYLLFIMAVWCLQQEKQQQQQLYYIFAHNTVITDLAPQVAEANRGGPGKIKINEIC